MYVGVKVQLHEFITSELYAAFPKAALTPGKQPLPPIIQWRLSGPQSRTRRSGERTAGNRTTNPRPVA